MASFICKLRRFSVESIVRKVLCGRWSEVVIYRGEARWVEVANDTSTDAAGQVKQILEQIDTMLESLGGSKDKLLEVIIYLADLNDVPVLNTLWDAWVDSSHPPIRACVQVGLQNKLRAEFIIRAAVTSGDLGI
jgi:enamine deaminase RidA (YjgF/YER057c/UK114 family)